MPQVTAPTSLTMFQQQRQENPQEKGGQLLNQDRAWSGIYDHTVLLFADECEQIVFQETRFLIFYRWNKLEMNFSQKKVSRVYFSHTNEQ